MPEGATAFHEGRPELIALSDQSAASGRQSLKVTDISGLRFAYDPPTACRLPPAACER